MVNCWQCRFSPASVRQASSCAPAHGFWRNMATGRQNKIACTLLNKKKKRINKTYLKRYKSQIVKYLRNLMEIWHHYTKILGTKNTESCALKCALFRMVLISVYGIVFYHFHLIRGATQHFFLVIFFYQ